MIETVILILECVAVAFFSFSGTLIAIRKRTDPIGALFFAMITCFGGGLIRDMIIGLHPPRLFFDREYAILAVVCAVTSLLVFSCSFIGNTAQKLTDHRHDFWVEGSDAMGLAIFCILGVESALQTDPDLEKNFVLLVFCGCITGVGGGVMRDIFSAQIPSLFRKHIYLIPALAGTLLYVLVRPVANRLAAIAVSVALILLLRFLAIRFRWNLPTPAAKGDGNDPKSGKSNG